MNALASCRRHALLCTLALAGAITLAGCGTVAPINPPIERVDTTSGYRMARLVKRELRRNHPEAMVLLAFSGGGTRAAALSYGVLEELRRTHISVGGQPEPDRSFLDEVDMVTGVSGGSFTALAYALYGERLFTEFEPRFLKRDVQGELIARALNPRNWARSAAPATAVRSWRPITTTRSCSAARPSATWRRSPPRRRCS